jgi:hypothetical protein
MPFTVERLVQYRSEDGRFLVKWTGMTVGESTWECEENLPASMIASWSGGDNASGRVTGGGPAFQLSKAAEPQRRRASIVLEGDNEVVRKVSTGGHVQPDATLAGPCESDDFRCGSNNYPGTPPSSPMPKSLSPSTFTLLTCRPKTAPIAPIAACPKNQCDWRGCGKVFARADYLKGHYRTHTGERPFACTWPGCGYRAAKSGNLKVHIRCHNGEKPFSCAWPGCSYKCRTSSHLKYHTRTHSKERPYDCKWEGCAYRATQSSALKRHMDSHKRWTNETSKHETDDVSTNMALAGAVVSLLCGSSIVSE